MENKYSNKILTIALALSTLVVGAHIKEHGLNTVALVLISISIFLLLFILLFQDWLEKVFQNLGLRIRNIYTDFIFESFKTSLEYLDDKGKKVTYQREDHISKLSLKKSKRFMKFPVYIDSGSISKKDTYSLKSSVGFISKTEMEFKVYFNNKDVYGKQHYSSYSSLFIDAFLKKEDQCWIIKTKNFCKFFQFMLVVPNKLGHVECKIYKKPRSKDRQTESKWQVSDIPFMKLERYGKTIIRIVIIGFSTKEAYKIEWDFT